MWNFGSPNRRNLTKDSGMPPMYFHVGSLMHKVLEEQIRVGGVPMITQIIEDAELELEQVYRETVGTGWSTEERNLVQESGNTVLAMATRYFEHWGGVQPLGPEYEYQCAEVTFKVPIPDTDNFFRGTIDGIAVHVPSQQVWIVEHKTIGDYPPKLEDLQVNYQMIGYSWAARELLGYPVAGVIYDGISKKIPRKPDLLKDGKGLSKQWITTTEDIYMDAIREHGFNPTDYIDILDKLRIRDKSVDNAFFIRHTVRYSERALDIFETELAAISRDMANEDLPLVPNFVWQGCYDCGFRDLCTATQLGEDVEWIVNNRYRISPGWRSTKAVPISKLVIGPKEEE
jgi:PD-(D/E)XK nuclease superfamily protein